jgi:uncharacterized membrane protein
MIFLLLGLVLFLGAHSISIANEPWRNRMVARLGENPWKGIYAVVSLVGFALIIWGYGLARQNPVVLYVPPSWFSHIAMVLMVFVFPLLLAAYLPGKIKSATKHPMLLATKIWALAHQWGPCRRHTVRVVSRLGGDGSYLDEAAHSAANSNCTGDEV